MKKRRDREREGERERENGLEREEIKQIYSLYLLELKHEFFQGSILSIWVLVLWKMLPLGVCRKNEETRRLREGPFTVCKWEFISE
jgi:hypothetical protein